MKYVPTLLCTVVVLYVLFLILYSSEASDIILGFALGSVEGRVAIQYVNAANPKVCTNCVSLYKN